MPPHVINDATTVVVVDPATTVQSAAEAAGPKGEAHALTVIDADSTVVVRGTRDEIVAHLEAELIALTAQLSDASVTNAIATERKAEVLRAFAKQAGLQEEIQNHAAVLKLRAQRRAGALLPEVLRRPEDGRPGRVVFLNPNVAMWQDDPQQAFHDGRLTQEQLGITSQDSHRWQKVASVPDKAFERYLKKCWRYNQEVTQAGTLRLAERLTKPKESMEERRQRNRQKYLRRQEEWLIHLVRNLGVRGVAQQVRALRNILTPDEQATLAKILRGIAEGIEAEASTVNSVNP